MRRRSLLQLPLLAWAADALAQARPSAGRVAAGADREGQTRAVGLSSTTFKVLTSESAGALFVMEQRNTRKGGPSRHVHDAEDELFFVLEGEYLVDLDGTRNWLGPGDCVLGPRGVSHAWAFVGDGVGRMLLSFAPANKMEVFFRDREARGIRPGQYARTAEDAALLREYGMKLIGPPLTAAELVRSPS